MTASARRGAPGCAPDLAFARRREHVTPTLTLREHLRAAPYTLVMSSGFFGFFAHAGMLSVLEDEGLLPAAVGGSSAGALVAGIWASGRSAVEIRDELASLRRHDFWDPRPGLGLLRGRKFRAKVEGVLGERHFHACRVPCFAVVHDVLRRRPLAVREGELAEAIVASCAVPGLFHPVRRGTQLLVDGGVSDRPGLLGVAPGARVLHHHLVSRSPWRGREDPAIAPPAQEGLTCLAIDGLPRLGPFRLERGMEAYETARARTREALARRWSPLVRV